LLMLALAFVVIRVPHRRKIPGLAVFMIFFGLTLGFSKWYSTLGGYCWGDRFFLPWIPGLSLFALWYYAEEFSGLLKAWVSRPVLFWVTALGLAIVTFPQYAFLLRQSLIGKVLDPPACAGLTGYAHENCKFWQPWPWGILEFYRPFPRPDLFLLAAFMSSWVIALCMKIRREIAASR
jgi:hypothetical protein